MQSHGPTLSSSNVTEQARLLIRVFGRSHPVADSRSRAHALCLLVVRTCKCHSSDPPKVCALQLQLVRASSGVARLLFKAPSESAQLRPGGHSGDQAAGAHSS